VLLPEQLRPVKQTAEPVCSASIGVKPTGLISLISEAEAQFSGAGAGRANLGVVAALSPPLPGGAP
jgi:hypothetical protein